VNWEKIKRAEKQGTKHARPSALDGIPKHLPALLRAEKLLKKARKANLTSGSAARPFRSRRKLAETLFSLAKLAQQNGWSAEELLRGEIKKQEQEFRQFERQHRAGT
jgi:uncharacterized protein YabN with tetrapyrrole methylase and pyrophosphatase domain